METNCEKVLAAAEKIKRRASKWDVPDEHHMENEVKIDDVLPAKVDDTFMHHTDSPRPCLSMDADVSEIDKSTNQSGKVSDNTIQSDVICEMPQHPKQFDPEGEYKDGFEKHDSDHASKKQIMAEYPENRDKPLKGTYEISPGPNERRHRTRSISPMDGRSRLDRKRNRSRSPPHDSRLGSERSGSWSRSRSPSYAYRQASERRTSTGRSRGMVPICRDFSAGRCQRDDCRFIHEGGGGGSRQIDRHHDAGSVDGRGSRSDKANYSREKLSRRHDDSYENGRDNTESHRDHRVPSRCFDFTKGRCQRGASCRYVHHGSSSDSGWNARDESRGRSHERSESGNRDSTSLSQRQEWRSVSEVPCKFFLENNCRHGESCRFLHHVKPTNIPVASSVDLKIHDQIAHFASSLPLNGQMQQTVHSHPQNLHNQFPALLPTPTSHYFNVSILGQPSKPLRYELNPQNLNSQVQVQQNLHMLSQRESSYNLNGQIQQNVPPIHNMQNPPDFNTSVPIQQNVPPIHNAQNQPEFNITVPTQQNVPPSHSKQNQPNFNFGVPIQQNIPPIHNAQTQSDFNAAVPIQSNVSPIHNAQNQPDFNLGVLIQQNVPPIHKAQNQTDFNLGVLIPQNVAPTPKAQNQADFNIGVPGQHNVPATHSAQNQSEINVGAQIQQNLTSDPGPSHQDVTVPLHISDPRKLLEKNQTSVQQHLALQGADSSVMKPSQTKSDKPITSKVVTSEQAAKIIDLSASLAQFFGTAALNSQSTTGMTPRPFLNPDSLSAFATAGTPLPTEVDSSQASLGRPIPSLEEKPRVQQAVSSAEREVTKTESPRISKDQIAQLPNDDEEGKKNEDNRKIKEGKDVRMFKCALIEFVKDMLKPKWKEGQLSKEAHKTIVKKVVDKVSGSLQGLNIPQTQEKIDFYLLNSKPKLSKLVQAYVEKYVKS